MQASCTDTTVIESRLALCAKLLRLADDASDVIGMDSGLFFDTCWLPRIRSLPETVLVATSQPLVTASLAMVVGVSAASFV